MLRILRYHGSPHFFDRAEAHGAITSCPGQHDGNSSIFMTGRHRFEEQIARRPKKMHELRLRQRERPIRVHEQMPVRRSEEDVSWSQLVAFFGF